MKKAINYILHQINTRFWFHGCFIPCIQIRIGNLASPAIRQTIINNFALRGHVLLKSHNNYYHFSN